MNRFIERPSGTWELAYERDPIGGRVALELAPRPIPYGNTGLRAQCVSF